MMEINLQAPINRLGYGVAGENICFELSQILKTNLYPIGQPSFHNPQIEHRIKECINNFSSADLNCPTVKIWHQHQLAERIGNGKYLGFPIFELDTLTSLEIMNLNCPHELIVCSKWAKEVLEKNGIKKKIHVVPLGIDTNIFRPAYNTPQGPYKFFNIGKMEIRKGHDILIECFNRAFDEDDDVQLHMLWDNPFLQDNMKQEWEKLYLNSKLGDKITLHNPLRNHEEVSRFINNMDCGVFPAKAEGWNLDLLEAMACGKPVITTNYSAHTEFCTADNAFLVNIDRTEPARDGIWFHGQGNWGFIGSKQKDEIIGHMRLCYKLRPHNIEGIETGKKFTWENSADGVFKSAKV